MKEVISKMYQNFCNDTNSEINLDEVFPDRDTSITDTQLSEENNEFLISEDLLKDNMSIEERQARAVRASDKALSEGIKALTNEERSHYRYYLRRYINNRSKVDRLKRKVSILNQKLASPRSPNMSGMPRGGTPITEVDLSK